MSARTSPEPRGIVRRGRVLKHNAGWWTVAVIEDNGTREVRLLCKLADHVRRSAMIVATGDSVDVRSLGASHTITFVNRDD